MRIPLTARSNGMRWPSVEDQLLVDLTQSDFGDQDREIVLDLCRQNSIDWKSIYRTARMHAVAPLVYRNLARMDRADLGMHNGSSERFRRSFARNLATRRMFREELWRILAFFNGRGLDVMLIKGASIDLFETGSGPYTVSRDIDLIIRARKEDVPGDTLAHISAVSSGFPLEFDFYGHHDVDMNGVLPIDWGRVWEDAIPVHYAGRDFYIMSQEDALITACINACRKRYFNLKAICAVDTRLRDAAALRWSEFTEKSRAYEVTEIVYAALLVAAQVMHSPVPADLTKRLAPSKAALLEVLSKRFSFSSLASLYTGTEIANRKIGTSLLLPYASYRGDQMWRKIRHAVSGPA